MGCAGLTGLPEMGSYWGGLGLFCSILHTLHSCSQPDPNRFDRDRLFSVVAQGVPEKLAGLPEYLSRTSKFLTDSEYTGGLPCGQSAMSCSLC